MAILCLSKNQDFLACGCENGKITLFRIENLLNGKEENEMLEIDAHDGAVYSLIFDGQNGNLLSAGSEGKIKIWSIQKNGEDKIVKHSEHSNIITFNSFKSTNDYCDVIAINQKLNILAGKLFFQIKFIFLFY